VQLYQCFSLQFTVYAFQVCSGGIQSAPVAALDYSWGGGAWDSYVLCVVHLFVIKVYKSRFGTSQQVEMAWHFS
jgi:hypothetical protein